MDSNECEPVYLGPGESAFIGKKIVPRYIDAF
jgi:hypothetical protein